MLFDAGEVGHKFASQAMDQSVISLQRLKRFAQRYGQFVVASIVGRGAGQRRFELARNAVQTSVNLRRDVKIRVSSRLANAVFNAGGWVARLADHAQHRAPVVTPPQHRLRCQCVGSKALEAVDGGRGQCGHAARVGQEAGQVMFTQAAQCVLGVERRGVWRGRVAHEGIAIVCFCRERLMKVPPTRHDVGKRWPAHIGGVVTRAAQRLRDGTAKQHHVIGSGECVGRFKHRFHLAGTQLDFQRQQRQAERLRGVLNNAQRLIAHVGPGLA